jgi:hypothetical protein
MLWSIVAWGEEAVLVFLLTGVALATIAQVRQRRRGSSPAAGQGD